MITTLLPADDPQYIVRLVGQVVRVSMETVRLVGELGTRVDVLAGVGVREEVEATASVEA